VVELLAPAPLTRTIIRKQPQKDFVTNRALQDPFDAEAISDRCKCRKRLWQQLGQHSLWR
jgi:hypothetical protein